MCHGSALPTSPAEEHYDGYRIAENQRVADHQQRTRQYPYPAQRRRTMSAPASQSEGIATAAALAAPWDRPVLLIPGRAADTGWDSTYLLRFGDLKLLPVRNARSQKNTAVRAMMMPLLVYGALARTEPVSATPSSRAASSCWARVSGRLSKRMPLPARPPTASL